MGLGIGIDTGGTFTDSVIIELDTGRVVSKAKALTTKKNLEVGAENSLNGLDKNLFPRVKLVSLSTTLATNSVVEGKGSRVGLIMAVPNPDTFSLPADVPAEEIAIVAGSHNKNGEVAVELDVVSVECAIEKMAGLVDTFAVSGYFSIYNAEHEAKIKDLIRSACAQPVVCGHELSGRVGMVERATTAALNAKLLPVIRELLGAVKNILAKNGIDAPLMVVKGDGSLISEGIALDRPVETVLSGPAASVVGACQLTGLKESIVVDMGGTTTDIAIVRDGVVATNNEGAVVGGWQTRVQAVDMWTIGLGGDSRITVKSPEEIQIGPRRAIPLCSAAQSYPELRQTLEDLSSVKGKRLKELDLDFFTLVKRPKFSLSKYESMLLDTLDGRVLHRNQINDAVGPFTSIDRFVELGFIAEVSFTPTDLLHAMGELNLWDGYVSEVAVSFLANKSGLDKKGLLDILYREIIELLKLNIASKALFEDNSIIDFWSESSRRFLGYLLRSNGKNSISADLTLKRPIVAVGAPVEAYFPRAAEELGSQLVIPEHSEVANAVGAVTGRVIEKAEVYIRPDRVDGFMVISADEHERFKTLEEAVAFAEERATSIALWRATRSGGKDIEVTVGRDEKVAPLASGWGDEVLMELRLTATAVGRPSI